MGSANSHIESGGYAKRGWRSYLYWILTAAILGFAVSALFSGYLRLPRNWFLVPYLLAVGLFLYFYARWQMLDLEKLMRDRLILALLSGAVFGFVIVLAVLRQPASSRPQGWDLAFDVFWRGITYGAADALLLTVLPMHASFQARVKPGRNLTWGGRLLTALIAVFASIFVTAAYHLGYVEFRGPQLINPVSRMNSKPLIPRPLTKLPSRRLKQS
jgi:hypothetical protein